MADVACIEHEGVKLIRIEFPAGSNLIKVKEIIAQAREVIEREPPESALTLAILGEFSFDPEMARAFGDFIAHNKSFVKAAAAVGITGLRKSVFNSITFTTRRQIKICQDEPEARAYLVGMNK